MQHRAQPVRCEDDDEIPTTAARRTRDAGEPARRVWTAAARLQAVIATASLDETAKSA